MMMTTMTATKTIVLAAMALAVANTGNSWLSVAQAFKLAAPATGRHHRHGTARASSPSSCSPLRTSSKAKSSMMAFHQRSKRRRKGNDCPSPLLASTLQAAEAETDTKNNISTSLKTNRNEKLFQQRLAELGNFRSQHGHGSIPTPYPPNPALGIWAANLRQQYTLWKRATDEADDDDDDENNEQGSGRRRYVGYLTPQRRRQLLAAGFDFTSLTERQFHTRLEELERFKETYGHCMVPERWEENMALGAWAHNLRSLYKRRRKTLTPKQQRTQQRQSSRMEQDVMGKRKKPKHKNILVQSRVNPKMKKLTNRTPRFSHLDEDRIKLLEEMGFVWASNDLKWLEMLEWAKVYGVVNDRLKLSSSGGDDDAHDGDINGNVTLSEGGERNETTEQLMSQINTTILLGNYHEFVRNIQDQTILSTFHPQDRILQQLLLEEDCGAHSSFDSDQLLQSFQPSHLDYQISPSDTLHQPLRIWMINQRSNYNRLHQEESESTIPSTMTAQRQKALEDIHFSWSGRYSNRVEEVQYEKNQLAEKESQLEKERRKKQKEQEESKRVERLLSTKLGDEDNEEEEETALDIMALWDAEDDEDDDW